jgi:hypothetical protein
VERIDQHGRPVRIADQLTVDYEGADATRWTAALGPSMAALPDRQRPRS